MNKITEIRMGTNAFDEKQANFRPIDIDRGKKVISKQGSEDGRRNFPAPQASTLIGAEQDIVSRISQTRYFFTKGVR